MAMYRASLKKLYGTLRVIIATATPEKTVRPCEATLMYWFNVDGTVTSIGLTL